MFKYKVKQQLRVMPGNVTVFEAVQKDLERSVEIRVLNQFVKADSDEYLRFEREFKTIARLDHPNVVKVYDWGLANDKIYYVTEKKPGVSCEEYVKQTGGPLDQAEALNIGLQVAKALAYLHKNQIVHRDISVLSVCYHAEKKLPYIAHFSLVKNLNLSDLTAKGVSHLQPLLMTPERVKNLPIDHRVDIYLFGAFLYHLLTGSPVIKRENEEMPSPEQLFQYQIVSVVNTAVDPGVDEVIAKMLDPDPAKRYGAAKDMVAVLEELAERVKVRSRRGSSSRTRRRTQSLGTTGETDEAEADGSTKATVAPMGSSVAVDSPSSEPQDFKEKVIAFVKEQDPKVLLVVGVIGFFLFFILLLWTLL